MTKIDYPSELFIQWFDLVQYIQPDQYAAALARAFH